MRFLILYTKLASIYVHVFNKKRMKMDLCLENYFFEIHQVNRFFLLLLLGITSVYQLLFIIQGMNE